MRVCLGLHFGVVAGGAGVLLGCQWGEGWLERARKGLPWAMIGIVLMLVILCILLTGPRGLARYPDAKNSEYRLPWRAGARLLCVQGNRAIVSHRDWEEFAYDFAMPTGSDVCAARGGTIASIDTSHDGNGYGMPNNQVVVDHGDGSHGFYLHLKKGGSYVEVGERVERGQRIGASGNVGLSMLPHLHFQVLGAKGELLPITFGDVAGDGIPRMWGRYTSGNAPAGRESENGAERRGL